METAEIRHEGARSARRGEGRSRTPNAEIQPNIRRLARRWGSRNRASSDVSAPVTAFGERARTIITSECRTFTDDCRLVSTPAYSKRDPKSDEFAEYIANSCNACHKRCLRCSYLIRFYLHKAGTFTPNARRYFLKIFLPRHR